MGLSIFMFGLLLGPTLSCIISGLWGRKVVYGIALPVSCLFTLGAGLSHNLGTLLVCRFFSAVFASPAVAVGPYMIGDMWDLESSKLAIIGYIFLQYSGPCFGKSYAPRPPHNLDYSNATRRPLPRRLRNAIRRLALDNVDHPPHIQRRLHPLIFHLRVPTRHHPPLSPPHAFEHPSQQPHLSY